MGKLDQIPGAIAPAPAVMRVLGQFDRDKLGAAIEVMIALLDLAGPDSEDEPDFTPRSDGLPGDPADHEDGGDDEDGADDELSGDEFDHSGSEDDHPAIGTAAMQRYHKGEGAGCPISDPDYCLAGDDRIDSGPVPGYNVLPDEGPGDADDAEDWRQTSNVPTPPVVSYGHNIFTDARVPLGFSNLQSSYRGGKEVRSADTGNVLRPSKRSEREPGVPV